VCVVLPNLVVIDETVAEILRFLPAALRAAQAAGI